MHQTRRGRAFVASMLCAASLTAGVVRAEDRSYDGSGNNVDHPDWGAVGAIFLRKSTNGYPDGFASMGGDTRPNPRVISNTIVQQTASMPNGRGLSDWVWQWGQFLDHDLTIAPAADPAEPVNIPVPAGDPMFSFPAIPFNRSAYVSGTGTGPGNVRCQMNMNSSWLDGSAIYGSTGATAGALRDASGGRMLVTEHATGDLLPMSGGMFVAGDERVNEQLGLTSVQTLFVREHNRWAQQVADANPGWSNDQVYQRARKIVGAEVQAITFNEWLPALVGDGVVPAYDRYHDDVDGTVANEFASALFRVGHTMLSSDLRRVDNAGHTIAAGDVALRDAFFQPQRILDEGGIDPLLKGLAVQRMQEVDAHVVEDIRSFLFTIPTGGMDLASLNIQRGRDHGLGDYNSVRAAYGLSRVLTFGDITSDDGLALELEALFGDVDNIDPWIGALAEDHLPGSSLGELLTAGILDQFLRARDGDRFWYENDPELADIRDLIAGTTLADIILRNSTITNLQSNVFFVPEPGAGLLLVMGEAAALRRARKGHRANR
ncbi:MAG: peroxiredoxin [Phycisphaerales bacterium]|nr:peroxiredoxin [Phycisphaerales bacterium]